MNIRHLLLSSALVVGTTSLVPEAHADMTNPTIAEIAAFGGNFCPRAWSTMEGQLLPIAQNSALFSILGTQFGGDGRTTFALPDARGRSLVGEGQGAGLGNIRIGQKGGSESFVILESNMPPHTHRVGVATTRASANSTSPRGNVFASGTANAYASGVQARGNFMNESTLQINPAGGGLSIQKRSPYLGITYCIALQGTFPSRN